jgi:aspartokinase/homoserine dehydrogenase 1
MRQNVFVIGATGNVGRELLRQIANHDVPELNKHENPTVVVGLADSKHFAIREGGFSRDGLLDFVQTRKRVSEVMGSLEHSSAGISALPYILGQLGYEEDLVFVDATSEKKGALDFHLHVIAQTRSKIAAANKNPVGFFSYEDYKRLTADPTRYRYSATAMAGLGAVPWLSERHTLGDRVHRIDASLSGTLGFITHKMSGGMRMSEAIRSARENGYTEPDYRDDLNGLDVARKLTILAREAGYPVELDNIEVRPFLPEPYFLIPDPEQCLFEIAAHLDDEMCRTVKEAEDRRCALRYLASLELKDDESILCVGIQEVPLDSPFAQLDGTDNYIRVVTDMYTQQRSYRLRGPGAGLDITASVLRRDLVNLQPRVARF